MFHTICIEKLGCSIFCLIKTGSRKVEWFVHSCRELEGKQGLKPSAAWAHTCPTCKATPWTKTAALWIWACSEGVAAVRQDHRCSGQTKWGCGCLVAVWPWASQASVPSSIKQGEHPPQQVWGFSRWYASCACHSPGDGANGSLTVFPSFTAFTRQCPHPSRSFLFYPKLIQTCPHHSLVEREFHTELCSGNVANMCILLLETT